MYGLASLTALRTAWRARSAGGGPAVGRTVVLLGVCSLLTDISSEMVATVLPLYLVTQLGFSPLQFGVVDGLYQGASALVRLAAGFTGDRLGRHKAVAATGYGLSAAGKLALATMSNGFATLSAIVAADRIGKGIRTAPRDAMISLSAPPERLGLAFGVHRAMDSAGAMLGPLVAFGLLAAAPGAFRTVFLVSFCVALLGLAVLTMLVDEPPTSKPAVKPPDLRAAAGLLTERPFRVLVIAAAGLGLGTISDAFVFLLIFDRADVSVTVFPLLATGTAATYMLLAIPAGRMADRHGRIAVFLGGYVALLGVYGLLLAPMTGAIATAATIALLGAYYAGTSGALAALGSDQIPRELRGSGLALLGTATSSAQLAASITFGALWTWTGTDWAVTVFGMLLTAALVASALSLRSTRV